MFTARTKFEESVSTIDTGDINDFSTVDVGDHVKIIYCFAWAPKAKIAEQPVLSDINKNNKVNYANLSFVSS